MRTTHKLHLTSARAIWAAVALFVLAGLVFAFAPMRPVAAARQALASRVNASPTAARILSIAPASVRRAIKTAATAQPKAANAAITSAANMMFAPVTITKDASPASGSAVGQGQVIAYTIQATNGASSDTTVGAGGFVRIIDTAPVGTLFTNVTVQQQPQFGSAWSCTILAGGTLIRCSAGDDAGAGVDTFTTQEFVKIRAEATVQAATANGTVLTNTATYQFDNDGGGLEGTATSNATVHVVQPTADLILDKYAYTNPTLASGQVIAGGTTLPGAGNALTVGTGEILYRIDAANAGPNNAFGVFVLDDLPANVEYVPGSLNFTAAPTGAVAGSFPSNFICDGDSTTGAADPPSPGKQLQCKPDDAATGAFLAAGRLNVASGVKSFTYKVRVPANVAQGAIIQNTAVILSAQPDPNSANNDAAKTLQTVVQAQTDLGITKVTSNPTPTAGGAAFSYTLVVSNNGPSDANNIVVTDPLPPGVIFQNVAVVNNPSVPGYGLVCTGPPNATNGTVTCTGNLSGAPGASTSTITIVAQIVANVASGVRTNTAMVSSSTQEVTPNTFPNTASVQQNIVVNAPLSITKAGPATVCAGDTFTYHITVLNGGSSTALNATISDSLPANTTFLNLNGTGGFTTGCSHNGGTPGTVTCAAVDIPTGLSTLDVTVKLAPSAPSGNLANTAQITTAGTGTIAVGTSTSTAAVNHCSDLQITKDDSPDAVLAGQDINYTLTVKNVGPSDIGTGEFVVNDTTFPPAGTTLKTGSVISAPGFNCNLTTAFPCTATAPLPAGASVQIKFTVTVNANFNNGQPGGFITNTATVNVVGGNTVDTNSQNNASTASTPVGPSADLSVQKQSFTLAGSAFDAQVTAGGAISAAPPALPVPIVTGQGEIFYGLTYRNSGLGDAVNVHVRDAIPANSQFVAGSIVVTPAAGPALTCTVSPLPTELDCTPTGGGTLPAGANGTISFRTRVLANVPDSTAIRNTATINSEGVGATPATPDPNGGNNSATTQNRVRTEANLSITKTGPASVNAGANITYTITVTNNGVSDAQNVVVKDTLPANVSFVSASSTNNQFVCTPDNGNAGVVNCVAATLIANDPNIIPPRSGSNTATITIIGKVAASVANGTVLANNATVSATTSDPVLANNSVGPINTTVTTDAAVTIVKTDNPDPVVAGTNLTYTITVANNGPSDAQAVNVVDTLPPATQVQFLSAVGTGVFSAANSCTQAANVVTCTAVPGGVFPAGATANITIKVKVLPSVAPNPLPQNPDSPNGLLNTATINWTDSNGVVGPLVANAATDTEFTTVRHESDMAILKEAPDFGIAGSRIDYRLTLRNLGPSDVLGDNAPQGALGTGAGSIIVRDILPLGTTLAPIAGNPAIGPGGPGNFSCLYTAATREVICRNAPGAAGNFPAGASLDFIIKVDIDSAVADGSNLVNCATTTLRNTNPTPEIDPLGGGQHNDADVVTLAASGNNQSCDTTLVRTSADLATSKTAVPVVDPDGAGPLAPVPLPIVGPNVPPGSVNAGGYLRYDVPFGNNGPSDAINVLLSNVVPGNTAFVGALATGGVFVPAAQPPAVPFTFTIQAADTIAPLGPNVNITCTVVAPAGGQQIFCRPQGNTALGAPGPYADGVLPAGYNAQLTFFVKVNESVAGGTIVTDPAIITSGLCPNGPGPVPPSFPPVPCASTPDPNTSNNTSQTTQNVVVASSNLSITKIVQSAVTAASNPNQTGPIGPATPQNGAVTTGTAVLPGTTLTYRITITNNGPSDVSNIRLTDVLPAGLETPPGRVLGVRYISVSPVLPSGATFVCAAPSGIDPTNNPQSNGGSLVCTAPLLSANAPNNTAAIDVKVFIDPATKANLVDVATVDATLNNFNRPISGSTTLTTPVAPTSDLALTKTISDADVNTPGVQAPPIIAGNTFQYTVTATNNGPSTGQMFSITDTFPPFQRLTNVEIGRLDPNGNFVTPNAKDGNNNPTVTCTAVPGIGSPGNTTSLTCTASELPPNKNPDGTTNPAGTIIFRLTAVQDPLTSQPPPPFQNCVSATSMSTDPIAGNSTNVCIPVPVGFLANPTGTKTDVPDPVIAGNLLTYTITATNPGPSAALNFRITDALPTGTAFISAVASPGATLTTPAVGANGVVTAIWNAAGGTPAGLTAPGVTRTLTIVVRVCPDFQQILGLTDAQMCVPNLTNNAVISSDTPGAPFTASQTTTVQAQSNLSIAKTGPATIPYSTSQSPSNITYTITFANAGPSNANGVTIEDILPKGFTVVSTTSSVPGTVFTQSSSGGIVTVLANLGVLGAANQCQFTFPISGTITIVARVPIKHPSISVTNQATILSTNCLPETGTLAVLTNPNTGYPPIITPGTGMLANNRAFATTNVTPPFVPSLGQAYPALSEVADTKEGSILFYQIYTSDAVNSNTQNTRITMTNTSPTEKVTVHLFGVDGASCTVLDSFLCLTPNQTTAFLASDWDPGATGYIMAVAVEDATGLPRVFNELIGDEYVKFTTGHAANLGAEAIAASMMFPAGVDANVTTTTLRFDGLNYNRLPRILGADNIGSPSDGNSTMLVVNRVGGNFSTGGATIGNLTGLLFNDTENSFSFTSNQGGCQMRTILSNAFPRTPTTFTNVIPAGRTGWLKLWAFEDRALLGSIIRFNSSAGTSAGAFNQGHNLHHLTLTDAATIVVPVFIPSC